MALFGGPNNFGLYPNGDFRDGNNSNFPFGTYRSSGGPGNGPYIEITGGDGAAAFSTEFIEIDPTSTYQAIIYAKTITLGDLSEADGLAGGHLGMACYNSDKELIYRNNLKGIGDTTLTRNHSPGDNQLFVADASGWSTGDYDGHRAYNIFGGQYPYSVGYTKYRSTSAAYDVDAITDIGGGEYRIDLNPGRELGTYVNGVDDSDLLVNGVYPAGTYVSNARSAATYNYTLGAPNYPTTWTKFSTPPTITGLVGAEVSTHLNFRIGTKYVTFLVLRNYNRRDLEPPGNHVYGLSQIFFGKVLDNKDYRNNINF